MKIELEKNWENPKFENFCNSFITLIKKTPHKYYMKFGE